MPHTFDPCLLKERLAQATVVVIGDAILDRTIEGDVRRISPEAPIPVMNHADEYDHCGGAANTAHNIVSLGASCVLISVIGSDQAGADLRTCLATVADHDTEKRPSALTTVLHAEPLRMTTLKQRFRTRLSQGGQQMFRLDSEQTDPISHESQRWLLEKVRKQFQQARAPIGAVVISDYAKGMLGEDTVPQIIIMARARGIPIIIDPAPRHLPYYRGASYLTPNRQECAAMLDSYSPDTSTLSQSVGNFCREHALDGLLLTRSEEGLSLFTCQHDPYRLSHEHIKANVQDVFDVTGAGDTVCAVFATALAAGYSPLQAAQLAQNAARVVITKRGTHPCHLSELCAQLAQ